MKKLRLALFSAVAAGLFAGPALLVKFYPAPVARAANPIEEGLGRIRSEFPSGGRFGRANNVGDFILAIINLLLTVTMVVAVLFLIVGGYQYITSAGNESRAEAGKKTVINALIGIVVIILSYAIVNVINRTLTR